jgi:hypothetical protein
MPNDNRPDQFADPDGYTDWILRTVTNRMRADADYQQGVSEGRIQDAYRDSEREIFGYGSNSEADINHDMRDLVEYHSQVESIDGSPLSDEEQMASLFGGGTDDPNYLGDRPVQHQYELEAEREKQELRDQLAASERARQQTENRYNPDLQLERDVARHEFMEKNGLFAVDLEKADALFANVTALQNGYNGLVSKHGNESMDRAHQQYGRDFETAYTSLQQMDPNAPLTQAIHGHIRNSADPGETVMQLHGSDLVASLGTGRYVEPPFARSREVGRGPVRVDRVSRDEDSPFNSGYGDASVEEAVFDSVFDKR